MKLNDAKLIDMQFCQTLTASSFHCYGTMQQKQKAYDEPNYFHYLGEKTLIENGLF